MTTEYPELEVETDIGRLRVVAFGEDRWRVTLPGQPHRYAAAPEPITVNRLRFDKLEADFRGYEAQSYDEATGKSSPIHVPATCQSLDVARVGQDYPRSASNEGASTGRKLRDAVNLAQRFAAGDPLMLRAAGIAALQAQLDTTEAEGNKLREQLTKANAAAAALREQIAEAQR